MNRLSIINAGTAFIHSVPTKSLKADSIKCAAKKAGKCASACNESVPTAKSKQGVDNLASSADKFVPSESSSQGVTENLAPVKKAKKQDQEFFHAYAQFKRIEFPISKAELDELLKLDDDKLIDSTVDLFIKKMKIPQSLKPSIVSVPQNKEIGMSFNIYQHLLQLNPNMQYQSKAEIIGFVAHELRHMAQSFDILRTEGLGEKAVTAYAKKYTKSIVGYIESLIKKDALEDYKKITTEPNAIADFKNLVKLRRTNPREYEKQITAQKKALEDVFMQNIEQYRQCIISEMGSLKADSEQGLRAKKYLKSFMTNYIKKDGTIDAGIYNFVVAEREALNLGLSIEGRAKSADEKFCIMNFFKTFKPRRLDDEARNKEIDEEIKKGGKDIINKMGWKEYLRYIYG